jgi:gluconate 2-dehydrogenase gamma chain
MTEGRRNQIDIAGDTRAKLGRRAFLGAGLSAASAAVGCRNGNAGAWRFFTPAQAETVDAICARLIPADADAGAREAGAVLYIDLQLSRRFKKHRELYRKGIEEVEAASRAHSGKRFAELDSERQVAILNEIEEKSKAFFDMVLTHARQGFYGDPRHGGNRGRVSWKMLGLATPPVRGREHYPG